jgi:Fur family ferric uptake transcriptional regulator
MSQPPHTLTVTASRDLLRGANLRCTTCRVAVLQHLSGAAGPQSHAEVADVLVPEGFDKSTIYRCLVELAEAGLALRHDLGDHIWRFEFRGGENQEHSEHAHFMCTVCGKVECLEDVEVLISPMSQSRSNLNSQVTEILLKGRCVSCK